jgi:hypothetical protein
VDLGTPRPLVVVAMTRRPEPDQFDMFAGPEQSTDQGTRQCRRPAPAPRGRTRSRQPITPDRVVPALADVHEGRFGLLDDTDRVMVFEDHDRVRAALDDDLIGSLMWQGYVERRPHRDTVSCRHGAIRRPVTPLRLTKQGHTLLARWGALKPLT